MATYHDLLAERVVVFDGATGTNLQLRHLGPDDFGGSALEGCNEMLCLTRPDVVEDLHRSFLDVGVDVVETNSFGALPTVLGEYGIADRAAEIARRSAELARTVARDFATPDRPRFVAGSMGPGTRFASLGQISFAELRDAYFVTATGLLEGGVDLILVETAFDLLGAKAAIVGARRAMARAGRAVPLQVQVTVETTGRMLPGTEIAAALCAIEAMRPDVVGLNCATGPAEMYEPIHYLSEHSLTPVSAIPNAGLPSVVDGEMHYDLDPDGLAQHLHTFVTELGVEVVGGCCGSTPEHMARVVERVGGLVPRRRQPTHEAGAASLYSFVPFAQDRSVLLVGERTNANGSKRFREAMLAGDSETMVTMARDQIREGAHLIDVCVDYTGADGVSDMGEVASRLATQSSVPLVIDSTEPDVVRTALEWLGGRAVLNSVNLEDGDGPGTRLDAFFSLAAEHGAAVVCTCIDEEGQARTADWKLRAARAIFDLAVSRYGLAAEDLFFDPLALPLSTGMEESRRDGVETIAAIRRIKEELPGTHTIIGLSNVSFGLAPAARHALNSVFLHECAEAGLDAAIVHASKILPLHKIDERVRSVCLDLIYDRRTSGYDPLAELISLFEGATATTARAEDEEWRSWPVERRLERRIIDGNRDGLEADLDEALAGGASALALVNDRLLAGMKVVGDLFGSGEMQLPFVLQSAETMKASVAYLEPHLERELAGSGSAVSRRGRIVLATVKGDVHDIGKNLVDIILSNNGYDVYNLGIKVPIAEMLDKAAEVEADAIGMSGLLVKSTMVMQENLEEMNRRHASKIPVLLGGAALTRHYVEHDLRRNFEGRVFYGRDAFEGLRTLEALMAEKAAGVADPALAAAPRQDARPLRRSERLARVDPATLPARSAVVADNTLFPAPFLGARIAQGIPLDEIRTYLNETALFRNQWGYRPQPGEPDVEFKDRVRAELRQRLDEAKAADALVPKVVWGYFPCGSVGDDLVVLAPQDSPGARRELTRFTFPRQREDPHLCIADFFRPLDGPEEDVVGFIVATMGSRATSYAHELFAADRYLDYVAHHGLSVEMTEALMELWHRRMREEWGFADEDGPTLTGLFRQKYRGGRYSFGYPACPDLADNARVVDLLDATRIGVGVSDGEQLEPEQTTLAIVCHHPAAKYFVV